MSVYDDRLIEIEAQKATLTSAGNAVFGDGSPGTNPGHVLGAALIIGGVIGTVATGFAGWPFGLIAVCLGAACFGGKEIVESNLTAMTEAIPDGPAAVNQAASSGCATLIGYLCVVGLVLFLLVCGLAAMNEIAGLTL